MTTILGIDLLPINPFSGSELVALVITSSVPSYFKVTGIELNRITHVSWYPENPSSVQFESRQMILLDETATLGTFMIKVTDNYLDTTDRGGKISFRLDNGTTLNYPVQTIGPIAVGRLWQSPYEGLTTG